MIYLKLLDRLQRDSLDGFHHFIELFGGDACAPLVIACSGLLWTSMINPSAPAATAARHMLSTGGFCRCPGLGRSPPGDGSRGAARDGGEGQRVADIFFIGSNAAFAEHDLEFPWP